MAKGSRKGKSGAGSISFKPNGLPELTGSEKQIQWAESIRNKGYEQLEKEYADYIKLSNNFARVSGEDAAKKSLLTKKDAVAIAKEVKERLDIGNRRIGSKASTIIDNRKDLERVGHVIWDKVTREYKRKKMSK